jgi:hypothetical protein
MEITESLQATTRLSRDMANAAKTLSGKEARYLVDAYYTMQQYRIAAAGQIRSMNETEEPHEVLRWFFTQDETLENQIKRALDMWTDGAHMGRWAKSICGIGPVISAGLLAHIDITKCPTVGHIWRIAGLDPTSKWLGRDKAGTLVKECCATSRPTTEELCSIANLVSRKLDRLVSQAGDKDGLITRKSLSSALAKRPWNAGLKTLCAFKLGESFVKVQNNENDVYGKVFVARKKLEQERNEAGAFAEQAKAALSAKNYDKTTEAYKAYVEGKLPPAHIHARARRYAVKLFLAHYHAEAYRKHYGQEPPLPYPIAVLGHAHMIPGPNIDVE